MAARARKAANARLVNGQKMEALVGYSSYPVDGLSPRTFSSPPIAGRRRLGNWWPYGRLRQPAPPGHVVAAPPPAPTSPCATVHSRGRRWQDFGTRRSVCCWGPFLRAGGVPALGGQLPAGPVPSGL